MWTNSTHWAKFLYSASYIAPVYYVINRRIAIILSLKMREIKIGCQPLLNDLPLNFRSEIASK